LLVWRLVRLLARWPGKAHRTPQAGSWEDSLPNGHSSMQRGGDVYAVINCTGGRVAACCVDLPQSPCGSLRLALACPELTHMAWALTAIVPS